MGEASTIHGYPMEYCLLALTEIFQLVPIFTLLRESTVCWRAQWNGTLHEEAAHSESKEGSQYYIS